jgi:hypothetical protein
VVGNHVELGQVALEGLAPQCSAVPQDDQSVSSGPPDQDRGIAGAEEQPDPIGQCGRRGRGLVEFTVEIVQQLTDRLAVGLAGRTDVMVIGG